MDMLTQDDRQRLERFIAQDPYLKSYEAVIAKRIARIRQTGRQLVPAGQTLSDFASGHEYYGLHLREGQWILREWAPNATSIHLIGEFSQWDMREDLAMHRLNDKGDWEIRLPAGTFSHGDLYRLRLQWPGGGGDRIPAWTRRVHQDPRSLIFNAQVWHPATAYVWHTPRFKVQQSALQIYEVHVGMAQDAAAVGSYAAFTRHILPRIKAAGYNTLQIMAIPEHPYYGSFGYQVSSFFAASSRFGPPEDLKALIDTAHGMGLTVLIDLVHSHAVSNEVEGISRLDGTDHQYFHTGPKGRHPLWDSRLFDYTKTEVLHFLLSNCRFWLDEFHVDGFRFDGVTSMLYEHHGLDKAFSSYDDYFETGVDDDALTYLALANQVIHEVRPDAITIAEDVSGMPGLARPWRDGGIGFDYRFAMGVPDNWIKLTKDTRDEAWHMGGLWFELNNRRHDEQTISYAESHDQALVGDQTLIFRLLGAAIYDHMRIEDEHLGVARGMALHKMIRLITLATAGHGYLNFMGNEFGHPEWIDFPREGNDWSYHYARRQWHLVDDPKLKYGQLAAFDRSMMALARRYDLLSSEPATLLWENEEDKILIFQRSGLVFAFNFHPAASCADYQFPVAPGRYAIVLNSDDRETGGYARIDNSQSHFTLTTGNEDRKQHKLSLYLPCRSAIVLSKID